MLVSTHNIIYGINNIDISNINNIINDIINDINDLE